MLKIFCFTWQTLWGVAESPDSSGEGEVTSATVRLDFIPIQEGKQGELARITLNRPDAANAFNSEMVNALIEAFQEPRISDSKCRALVLSGVGKHFCAGADLVEMGEMGRAGWEVNLAQATQIASLYHYVRECPVPTIALVHGSCFGGGVGLVAACDWAIAKEDARFCLSEVRVGAVAGVILPYLTDKVEVGALRRWVLQARTLTAEEARNVGLVQSIGNEKTVEEELTNLLSGSPEAQRAFKRAHLKMTQHTSTEMAGLLAKMRASASGQEGIQAFLEKRVPRWKATCPKIEW